MLCPVADHSSVNTIAAAADSDDAGRLDDIAAHPEHLLHSNMGSCTATKLVFLTERRI